MITGSPEPRRHHLTLPSLLLGVLVYSMQPWLVLIGLSTEGWPGRVYPDGCLQTDMVYSPA